MAEIAKRVRGEEAWSKRPTHRGSSSGQPNREQRQRRLVSVVAMVARDGLNRWRIGRGAGRSAYRAALRGPMPRSRGGLASMSLRKRFGVRFRTHGSRDHAS